MITAVSPARDRIQANARRRRERWARHFRPDHIATLIVAEAPPSDLDRYFYFPAVSTQDSLFRYVVRLVLGMEPTRENKRDLLERLREARVYLIDLSPEPLAGAHADFVPGLVRRVRRLDPGRIILVKAPVFDAAYSSLREAGLPVVNVRVPFPGSGQQRNFEVAFSRALRLHPVAANPKRHEAAG